MHCVATGQTVNKEYYVEVLREFRKRFLGKRPALFKSGQYHFHRDNRPVHNSILVTDYLTKMSIKTVPHRPYSPDLASCDFWLFPKLRGCRRYWGDEKSCDEGNWHAHTRGLPWGLAEVVGTVQQVHCSWRRLLRRGLQFHVCTINKSAHTKKVWKLIEGTYIYIYIYIYVCVCVCVCVILYIITPTILLLFFKSVPTIGRRKLRFSSRPRRDLYFDKS